MGGETFEAEAGSDRQAPTTHHQQASQSQSNQEGSASEEQLGGEGQEGRRSNEAEVPAPHQPQQQHPSLAGNTQFG